MNNSINKNINLNSNNLANDEENQNIFRYSNSDKSNFMKAQLKKICVLNPGENFGMISMLENYK